MDIEDYIINSKTGKVLKIGGKAHKTAIINKIRNTDKNKTLISDIDYEDSKKLKSNCGAERHHYSMFNVGRSMFDVRRSVCSMIDIRRSSFTNPTSIYSTNPPRQTTSASP